MPGTAVTPSGLRWLFLGQAGDHNDVTWANIGTPTNMRTYLA